MQSQKEVDLLVIGAGAAGMATALVAALEGLDVMVLEKSSLVGGTASTSAGSIWIPGNTQSLAAGYQDSVEKAAVYMQGLIGDDVTGLRSAYLRTGPIAVDYLRKLSEVRFVPCGKHPDYRDMDGAAITGRALVPEPFDGRKLGSDFARIRPPIQEFMVLNGMMVGKEDIVKLLGRFKSLSNFSHSVKLVVRYFLDRLRYRRGTRIVMGNALIGRLFFSLKNLRVPFLFDVEVSDLATTGGSVTGVIFKSTGKIYSITARKGVVLATGGIGHNQHLRELAFPKPTPRESMACSTISGDGILLGRRCGGAFNPQEHRGGGFWTPISVINRRDESRGLYPHLFLDRAKPGIIAVNLNGERFVNEANSYHDFVEGMYRSNTDMGAISCYLVCEAHFITKYGLGIIYPKTRNLEPFVRNGYILKADSLEALGSKMGVPTVRLAETIQIYNQFCKNGRDMDFGKGDTELNRFNGDSTIKPNPCLAEIKKGPFVALRIFPSEIASSAGLKTNADGQVLTDEGRVIEGLYACGNDMASVMAGTYPGPGTTLGPGITFGYRIAMHAAGKSEFMNAGN